MGREYNIPESWIKTSIDEVIHIQKGKKPVRLEEFEFEDSEPYLDIRAFERKEIREYADKFSSHIIDENDLVMVWDGARSGWVSKGMKGALGSTIARFKPFLISQKYLYYFLSSQFSYLNTNAKGTGIPHVDPQILWGINMPFPPFNEQDRIVSKIEELFSDLDNGIANFKLAQNQLKVYRQALLKSAFEGKLTEQWRQENNPEPAEKLIESIKDERKKRYEQDLKDWKEAVRIWERGNKKDKKPSKPSTLIDFPDLRQGDIDLLPVIPNNWVWVRNNEILYYVTSGSRDWKQYYSDNGAYFIRTQDIKTNKLDLDGAAYVELPKNVEGKRSLVQSGDLLMTITGANVGKVAYIKDEIPEAYVSQSVALMKPVNIKIAPYLQLYFQSDVYGGKMISGLVYGVGRPVLSLENMREAPVVICSFEEQEQIISEIDSQFSIIDNLEKTINDGIQKSEYLRQSILKKAFEGKLIAQDPNDEPAIELLKRIKAEKKKYLEEQKNHKKRTPKKTKKMSKELSINEVLQSSDKPMLAKDVWQQSKHKDSIEDFYAELKKIQNNIKEIKKGTESLLSLIK